MTDTVRTCQVCGRESGEDSWRLAGRLAYSGSGACIYCLTGRRLTPVELWRAYELGLSDGRAVS